MAKHGKKSILAILLTLCLVCGVFGLAACGGDDKNDTSVTYTVTVMKDQTTAASGVKVTPKKGSARFGTEVTDENGKVSFSLAPDTYTVTLTQLPEHYELPADANLTLTPEDKDLTITLAPKTAYTVHLTNADGTPFTAQTTDISVGICTLSGNCLTPVAPTNGTATIEASKGDYHVKIDGLVGYVYENDENSYYTGGNLSASVTEISIKLYPAPAVDFTTAMAEEERTAFGTACESFAWVEAEKKAYKFAQQQIAAGAYAYYTVTPNISGEYARYSADESAASVEYYVDTVFRVQPQAEKVLGSNQAFTFNAGKTYYVTVKNTGSAAVTTNTAIVAPVSSYQVYKGAAGEFKLTVGKKYANAVVEFLPPAAGEYKLTVQGTTPAIVSASFTTPGNVVFPNPADAAYSEGANAKEYYASWDLNAEPNPTPLYFAVTVNASTYPATVTVKIEKLHDQNDSYTDVEPATTLATYAPDTNGKELVGVPMTAAALAALTYNDQTDRYTYDGKEVVVMLTESIGTERYDSGHPFAYIDQYEQNMNYVASEVPSEGYGLDLTDYRYMLRGFKNYVQGRELTIPTVLDKPNCYAANVNKDGVYPLTKELETCIKALVTLNDWFDETNYSWGAFDSVIQTEVDAAKWMFPLYYYDTATEEQVDAIVGEYNVKAYHSYGEEQDTEVDGETYREDDYMLSVTKAGGFTIKTYQGMNLVNLYTGTWTKNSETSYTFTTSGSYWDAGANGFANGEIIFTGTFTPLTRTLVLSTTVEPSDGPVSFTFFVPEPFVNEDGYWNTGNTVKVEVFGYNKFVITDTATTTQYAGTWEKTAENTYTFTVTAPSETYAVTYDADANTLTLTLTGGTFAGTYA